MSIHEVYIYLRAKNAEKAIDFYKNVFGASEKFRLVSPDGRIGHIELSFGGTVVMLSDEFPEFGIHAPDAETPSSVSIHLHVDDADALIAKCAAAGATIIREATDQFYGERSGTIRDPFGYSWIIGHSIEEIEPEEMQRRYDAMGS